MSAIRRILADPSIRENANRRFELIARLTEGDALTEREIAAMILVLLEDEPGGPVLPEPPLYKLGRRAEPFLLAALEDQRCEPGRAPSRSYGKNPFEKVCEQLARIGSPKLLSILRPELDSDDIKRRRSAGFYIAHLGTPEVIEPVLRAVRDDEGEVHGYAVMGIGWSTSLNHASAPFRQAMFDELLPYAIGDRSVAKPVRGSDPDYARTLFHLDRDRAAAALTTAHALRPENPGMMRLLDQLVEHHVAPEAAPMLHLYEHHIGRSPYSTARVRGSVLVVLARAHPQTARPMLEEILAAQDPQLPSERADTKSLAEEWPRLQGLAYQLRACTLDGLPLPHEVQTRNWPDPPGAPTEARNIELVHALVAEVANGSLDQYFYNSSGDDWPQTLAMLEEIGHAAAADCLRRAAALFGDDGPALDRSLREDQLEELYDDAHETLGKLSNRLLKASNDIDRLLADYIRAHAAAFRSMPEPTSVP